MSATRWSLLLVGPCIAMLAACGGAQLDFRDRTVEEERRIELKTGGPQTGIWQGRHVKVEYRYAIDADRMRIEGRVIFPRQKYIDTFRLNLNITGAEGRMLASDVLASAPYRKIIEVLPFQQALQLPEGYAAMVFSYSGATRGFGEGAGSENPFWQLP